MCVMIVQVSCKVVFNYDSEASFFKGSGLRVPGLGGLQ